jgi:GMP synthase-like glutamine amidotransferase
MKILILQHETSVTPGPVLEWAKERGFEPKVHFISKHKLSPVEDFDLLVICGGNMNVNQEQDFPWLIEEKKFIKSAISKNKKIMGLCLGGQLLAECLGGSVFKAPAWEIGWHKIKLLEKKEELTVFHWHAYQFSIPSGAIKTSLSDSCPEQGFRVGRNVLAYQFHPESTKEWVTKCSIDPDLPPKAEYVQNTDEIIEGLKFHEAMKAWFFSELDWLIKT